MFYNIKPGGRGGCGRHSDITKQRIKDSLRGKMSGDKNPMFGRNAFALMTEDQRAERVRKFKAAMVGKVAGSKNGMYGKSVLDFLSEERRRDFVEKSTARCLQNSKALAEKNKGQPWNNPAVRYLNKVQWAQADIYYTLLQQDPTMSSGNFNKRYLELLPPLPISMLKKFRQGWVPSKDSLWSIFSEKFNNET